MVFPFNNSFGLGLPSESFELGLSSDDWPKSLNVLWFRFSLTGSFDLGLSLVGEPSAWGGGEARLCEDSEVGEATEIEEGEATSFSFSTSLDFLFSEARSSSRSFDMLVSLSLELFSKCKGSGNLAGGVGSGFSSVCGVGTLKTAAGYKLGL